MRGVVPKVKKQMGLKKKMNRLLFSTMIPMACLLVILLLIFWQYAGQYNKLSENLAVSSKFNLSFKDELDLEMYYLAIGSKEASELDDVPARQVQQRLSEEAIMHGLLVLHRQTIQRLLSACWWKMQAQPAVKRYRLPVRFWMLIWII